MDRAVNKKAMGIIHWQKPSPIKGNTHKDMGNNLNPLATRTPDIKEAIQLENPTHETATRSIATTYDRPQLENATLGQARTTRNGT